MSFRRGTWSLQRLSKKTYNIIAMHVSAASQIMKLASSFILHSTPLPFSVQAGDATGATSLQEAGIGKCLKPQSHNLRANRIQKHTEQHFLSRARSPDQVPSGKLLARTAISRPAPNREAAGDGTSPDQFPCGRWWRGAENQTSFQGGCWRRCERPSPDQLPGRLLVRMTAEASSMKKP